MNIILAVHKSGKSVQNFNPSNIFISKEGNLKLLDFCFGKKFKEFFSKSKTFLNGDPLYLAPEIILKGNYYPESSIWSLGSELILRNHHIRVVNRNESL
jgi:serine/threonine protein kinase